METLTIPHSGLALIGIPPSNSHNDPSKAEIKPKQVMQLQLPQGMLRDFLKNTNNRGKEMHISMGKVVTLHYGNKSQQLLSTPQTSRNELYSYSADNPNEIAFTGLLSHKLDIKTAQDSLAGTDSALAMLQSQMASHQKDKQSKQIHFVPDGSNLPPPIQQKQATIKQSSASFIKKNNAPGRLNNATARSIPNSLGPSRSSPNLALASTSAPTVLDVKSQKLQALRTPIIHLLAVRPVSTKFLAQKICCSQQECLDILQKVGREHRLDSSKWDLSDKSFKELDIWKFAYPQEEDRQFAIDRAVSAFDRLRLSREEKLWQMLLPKNERDQGKVLSKLNLHAGPIPKAGTPRIQLQPTDDSNPAQNETSNESDRKDRLAPSDAEAAARARPQKKKVSEKEAQSKRLLSKNPKKVVNTSKTKENPPSVVRKVPKKNTPSTSSNIKSTEFVHDSDEDERMEDIQPIASKPSAKPAPSKLSETKLPKDQLKTSKTAAKSLLGTSAKPKAALMKGSRIQKNANTILSRVGAKKPPSSTSSSGSRNSPSSVPMTKSLSRQRTSSSPHKPSPLGSSPPTNASDLDNDAHSHQVSSTSSTPLIAQSRKVNNATPKMTPKATSLASRPLQNTSECALKRKTDDVDSDLHHHNNPLTNGNTNTAKRHKASILSPPTSESSHGSNSPPIQRNTLELAQRFKIFYTKYEELYREVSSWQEAPKDKVDAVLKMHVRLAAMKDEIAKSLIT